MNRIIIIFILISFAFTCPAFASLSWTCPNCGQTFYFDDRDQDYMNSWIPIHLDACRGGSSSSSSSDPSYNTPHGRPSFEGSLLIGGLAGGVLGGVFALAFAPDAMWGWAIGGSVIGAGFTGLLWWASEPPSYEEAYVAPTPEPQYATAQPVATDITYNTPSNNDTSVVDLSDKTSDVVDINVVRGVNISNIKVDAPVENPAQFKHDILTDYTNAFDARIQKDNDTVTGVIKSLKIKAPPSPIKNLSELTPGDVILISPDGKMSKLLNKVDRWASDDSRSPASHTATYIGEKYGKRFYLNNTPEEGPVIMEERYFLAKYYERDMHVATMVGEPLSKHQGDELWKGATELTKTGGYGISTLPSPLKANDNMVCSEASRWLLLRAGKYVPETKDATKSIAVKFSPADFYDDQQYFIVHKLGMNK
jgi:hypothetical protein